MLVGNLTSLFVGGLVCIVISLSTKKAEDEDEDEVWEHTRHIDNPLATWAEKYAGFVQ